MNATEHAHPVPTFRVDATLPDELSGLIRLALSDLRKVERSKKYVVNMGIWHDPQCDDYGDPDVEVKECRVCFAGAVMAKTLKVASSAKARPYHFPHLRAKFKALDYVRMGDVDSALRQLGIRSLTASKINQEVRDTGMLGQYWEHCSYDNDRKQFHRTMRKLADFLQERGY